nr:PREDICTED: uncharacterized protein LOC108208272 [Daucus carota subsp. sativus]
MSKKWKSIPYEEKSRADLSAENARKGGLKSATRRDFKPHYFNKRTWDKLCNYWESEEFLIKSKNGKEARKKVEHIHHSGAKSFDERRQELEEKNNGKISELDFISQVYCLDDPKTQKLKEDIEKALASQPTEPEDEEMTDPPPSPNTLKMNQRRKALSLIIQVRPPKKGKAILFPRHPVTEVLGAYEAAKFASTQPKQNSTPSQLSTDSVDLVVRVSAEVHRMVRSLEMREVPRSFLNEQMHRLADEAFPDRDDLMQQESWSLYMRLATAFVVDALKMNDKVILEGTSIEKAPVDRDISGNHADEDIDEDADQFPL